MTRVLRLASVAVAVLACAAAVVSARAEAPPSRPLPNLRQALPSNLSIKTDRRSGHHRLGFSSAVHNLGAGPLVIDARRAGPRMVVHQVVAGQRLGRPAGLLDYERAGGHQHWHLEDFDRYELIALRSGGAQRRARKAGFCLGDREPAPGERGSPIPGNGVFTHRCGIGRPELTQLREGISPGWSDDYQAHLEGQSIDVTGLRSGLYVLRHRANPARALVESDYADNAASMLLRLMSRSGDRAPRFAVLRRCRAAASCRP